MKAPLSIAAVAVFLVTTFLVMGAANPKQDMDDSIAQLRARIRTLEQRVDILEKKLQKRQANINPPSRRPSNPPLSQRLPRGWHWREFNGIPYYLVPLNQKQRRSSKRNSIESRR